VELVDLLSALQAPVFLSLGVAAAVVAVRHRRRPPAYLAAAFLAIGAVTLLSLLQPGEGADRHVLVQVVVVACLASYPWWLAAFAWSFAGRLPTWLRAALGFIVIFVAAYVPLHPFPGSDEPATLGHQLFLAAFVAVWALLSTAMAVRLWRAGGRQRLVRARMRLMASGAVLLTLALFITVVTPSESVPTMVAVRLLVLLAAVLFATGFMPPPPLRLWWRRRATHEFQEMQAALIGAATPLEVATTISPLLADLVGGGVVVLEPSGEVLTAARLDDEEVQALVEWHAEGGELDERTTVIDLGPRTLVLRRSPYTPVFGKEEHELVEAFSLQLRLALERAELLRAAERARQAAEASRAELEGTLLGLAHDLKSPTLAISGFAGLLPHTEDADERAEMVEHIQASTVYLRQLVDALVEVSRVGHTQTAVEEVDLGATCASVAQRVAGTNPAARIEVAGDLPTVWMNPVRAEQMLDNLVNNALRHGGRPDPTITISSWRDGQAAEIVVADDGRGIDPEDRERIFGLFQRGRSTASKGSGVGLGMVRRIAQASGGTLTLADSERGATFVIRLPGDVVVEPPAGASAADDPSPAGEVASTPG
jgi:signal transduction histidine kinase